MNWQRKTVILSFSLILAVMLVVPPCVVLENGHRMMVGYYPLGYLASIGQTSEANTMPSYAFNLETLEASKQYKAATPDEKKEFMREFISRNGRSEIINQFQQAIKTLDYFMLSKKEKVDFEEKYFKHYGIDRPIQINYDTGRISLTSRQERMLTIDFQLLWTQFFVVLTIGAALFFAFRRNKP